MSITPVSVSSPADFQREVNQGTPHIIIQEHLDLTGLGPAEESSELNELLVHQASTLSIRVCSGPFLQSKAPSRI